MPRIPHGQILSLKLEGEAGAGAETGADSKGPAALPCSSEPDDRHWPFAYLFPGLNKDPDNVLSSDEKDDTVGWLRRLGAEMMDPGDEVIPGIPTPTIYTFFGQFVDHDITLEKASDAINLSDPDLKPIDPDDIEKHIVNSRSPDLDLDSVYWPDAPPDPANQNKLRIGIVTHNVNGQGLPSGKDVYNDLPRGPKLDDYPECDRVALIGDTRNDENLILSQLHVAFLRAHNAVVDRGYGFEDAKRLIKQHYQWIVLNDFLDRVADPAIVKRVRNEGPRLKFQPDSGPLAIPLEFSVAAYRFGHSKVRQVYLDFNKEQPNLQASALFGFTRFGGDLGGFDSLLDSWVIDWTAFLDVDDSNHLPRPIDTTLSEMLTSLPRAALLGKQPKEANLAVRNLLRGYLLALPTGQALATAMGIKPMGKNEILSVAVYNKQSEVLSKSGFLERTPLWFYILAEAAYYSRGWHLGPMGSTIVAEVLIEILRRSKDSILLNPYWRPTLSANPQKFDLSDFLKLAGVL